MIDHDLKEQLLLVKQKSDNACEQISNPCRPCQPAQIVATTKKFEDNEPVQMMQASKVTSTYTVLDPEQMRLMTERYLAMKAEQAKKEREEKEQVEKEKELLKTESEEIQTSSEQVTPSLSPEKKRERKRRPTSGNQMKLTKSRSSSNDSVFDSSQSSEQSSNSRNSSPQRLLKEEKNNASNNDFAAIKLNSEQPIVVEQPALIHGMSMGIGGTGSIPVEDTIAREKAERKERQIIA